MLTAILLSLNNVANNIAVTTAILLSLKNVANNIAVKILMRQ